MKSAEPRTLEALQRRGTYYEVAAVHEDGRRVVVGFTARRSRVGLVLLMQSRGEELVELLEMGEDDDFELTGGPRAHFWFKAWRVGFTGRTEREVRQELDAAVRAPLEAGAIGEAVALMNELRDLTGQPYAHAVRRALWRLVAVQEDSLEEVRGPLPVAEHAADLRERVRAARQART